jgi:ABC-type uncharacterized transport system permease subunit
MTLIWLRVALVFYAVGLLYALVALTRTSEVLGKVALHASYLGMVFHLVSLTEAVVQSGQLASASIHNSESLLAFLVMCVFMLAYLVYKTTTPGIDGKVDFRDPKILLSVLMWAVYLLMVYTRLNAGWRGRRAAMLASVAFLTAIVAWIANYFSGMHRFIPS